MIKLILLFYFQLCSGIFLHANLSLFKNFFFRAVHVPSKSVSKKK